MPGTVHNAIYEIAEEQNGYLTASQAEIGRAHV